jgi:large subunit ribosomal protein L10
MSKELRKLMVQELKENFKNLDHFILVSHDKLNSEQIELLRSKLREKHVHIKALKNTIANLVFKDNYKIDFSQDLCGPVALVYGEDDPVESAKVTVEWTKKINGFIIKSGYLQGSYLKSNEVMNLAKSPNKKALLGMIAGGLQDSVQQTAYILTAGIQEMSYAFDSYIEKLEKNS